jgi:flavin reductase (DIM6/NTAB) family NADH-FMN oxidoreductase RutF
VELLKVQCDHEEILKITYTTLFDMGLLLSSRGSDGRLNAMAVGWALVGKAWTYPVVMVAVRPTTYTYKLIEETNEFTLNVPSDNMKVIVDYFGKVSGRNYDKFREKNIKTENGIKVKSPIISDCIAHYECEVILKSKVAPELLPQETRKKHYLSRNYHTLYFGKILTTLKEQ